MPITFDSVTSIITAVGVAIACYQLWQTRLSLRADFERSFFDRYQRIAEDLPLEVLLGSQSTDLVIDDTTFFKYFELCEEELYFRAHRRVSSRTWRDWWYGIRMNMASPAFAKAFDTMVVHSDARSPNRFVYLNAARDHFANPAYQPRRLPVATAAS